MKRLDNLGRFCGALGFVLLLSAPLTSVLTEGVGPLVLTKVVLGGALVGVYLVTHPGWLGRWLGGRSRGVMLVHATTAVMVVIFVAALNVLATFSPYEMDLTHEALHTLSPQTQEVLARLRAPVQLYAFYREGDPGIFTAKERLARYAAHASTLTYEVVSPDARPELVTRFGLRPTGPRIVVVAGEHEVRALDASEEALTTAIVQAAERPAGRIAFVLGHGEASPDDDSAAGFTLARDSLRAEGYEVQTLRLLDTPGGAVAVPEGFAALIVAGARAAWMPAELGALEGYLNGGGRALVMLEPQVQSGLEGMLEGLKVGVDDDIVADTVSQMLGMGWAGPVIQTSPGEHPITAKLTRPVVMMTARSLRVLAQGPPRAEAKALMQTGHSAWGELSVVAGEPTRDAQDLSPPLVVMAAVTVDLGDGHSGHGHAHTESHSGRLVVSGDADWMNNRLAAQQGNTDLFLNAIAWLCEREEKIAIRPRSRARGEIALAPQDLSLLKFFSLDILPVFVIATGAGVVWIRRRR